MEQDQLRRAWQDNKALQGCLELLFSVWLLSLMLQDQFWRPSQHQTCPLSPMRVGR